MITPQEVAQRAFSKASFGGYNMAQVDEFLDILTADYTALYKENAVLKSKMKVLVDKVEEYRATEDAMRMTLLSAQKLASTMVSEAEEKKNEVIWKAEAEAKRQLADIRQEIKNEEYRLAAAQRSTADFLSQLQTVFSHHQDFLSHLSELTATPQAEEIPGPVEAAAADIEHSVQKLIEENLISEPPESDAAADMMEDTKEMDMGALDAGPPDEQAPAKSSVFQVIDITLDGDKRSAGGEVSSADLRIDFNNLQFGKDYEIK